MNEEQRKMLLTNIENLIIKLKGNYKDYVIKDLIRLQNWGIKKYELQRRNGNG